MNSIKKNNIAILIMKRMEAWSYFGIILWLYSLVSTKKS